MFDPAVLGNDPVHRALLLQVLASALAAVDPVRAVRRAVSVRGGSIRFGNEEVPLPQGRILVLGLGKAAAGMARGLAAAVPGVGIHGVVATPNPGPLPPGIELARGSHPFPDASSLAAGTRLMDAARSASAADLVVVLLSGGASACAEVPAPGLDIDEVAAATRALLASGVPIGEVNLVRRRLSALKGGGLAAAAHPARLVTLVLSDVPGNHLPTIGGGPTVPDDDSGDALTAIESRGLASAMGRAVMGLLSSPRAGDVGGDPGPVVIVGDGPTAAEGARLAAERLGIPARRAPAPLVGEAGEAGRRLGAEAAAMESAGMNIHSGETTVTVRGRGRGGRNQELALAAGICLEGVDGALVASLGTDGVDGPTTAAGGIGDGATLSRGRALGLDARSALEGNDSGGYLGATGDLLITGPTGTNVGDVAVVYRAG